MPNADKRREYINYLVDVEHHLSGINLTEGDRAVIHKFFVSGGVKPMQAALAIRVKYFRGGAEVQGKY